MDPNNDRVPDWMDTRFGALFLPQFVTMSDLELGSHVRFADQPIDKLAALQDEHEEFEEKGENKELEEEGSKDDEDIELPSRANRDREDDPNYVFKDDVENYFNNYEYPADANADSSKEDEGESSYKNANKDRNNKEDGEEKRLAFEIQSDEDLALDVESLESGVGEKEVGDIVKIVDGLDSAAQAQACRKNIGTFLRSREHSSSILTAMVNRYERDSQLTAGI
ncbi:hypothetical protein E8E12_006796 [Didymella heteroderae]|uniref:Uncharacterized protein n=1 Tax=Didymella heteroderae TaxID=1769908 RepID=A0A9P4WTA8_9PLEO|nr:hypothetical protein E8E12_006796 [Didymella heteroderae]